MDCFIIYMYNVYKMNVLIMCVYVSCIHHSMVIYFRFDIYVLYLCLTVQFSLLSVLFFLTIPEFALSIFIFFGSSIFTIHMNSKSVKPASVQSHCWLCHDDALLTLCMRVSGCGVTISNSYCFVLEIIWYQSCCILRFALEIIFCYRPENDKLALLLLILLRYLSITFQDEKKNWIRREKTTATKFITKLN